MYALMGRLVRSSIFRELVLLEPGAKLLNVWVDGQRGAVGGFNHDAINILLNSGSNTQVRDSVISNTTGWSNLVAGSDPSTPCTSNIISGNLVTVYNSDHFDGTWSDCLSIPCGDALVENNQIVDATDGAIVIFGGGAGAQSSIARTNVILSAGNSAYGALIFEPQFPDVGPAPRDFSGATFTNNLIWTAPNTHLDFAVAVGTQAWWHDLGAFNGVGASVTDNSSGTLTLRCNSGIAVDGMLEATVQGNTFAIELVEVSACPSVQVGADLSNGHASGNLQTFVQTAFHGCIGH